MKTKTICLLLILSLVVAAMSACSLPTVSTTRNFIDSAGRTVVLPTTINRIAVTGTMAQLYAFSLAPDKLVGIASPWDVSAAQYIDDKYLSLPVLGQLYGGKNDFNLETLLSADPQVIIDVGEYKEGLVADLDALQEQTGIPCVHITTSTASMGKAYRALGDLLGLTAQAAELGNYSDSIVARTHTIMNEVGLAGKVRMLYCLGDQGHNVIARDSYHSEVIDLLSDNLAVIEQPSAKGLGNEVDMEQILLWNPDVIVFAPQSVYPEVAADQTWQQISAISSGRFYQVPSGPDNWLGFPPSVQRCLGMLWLAKLLYPEIAQYDLFDEVAQFYQMFYHCVLTPAQYEGLMAHALAS